ncbi:MAG: type I-E CRISPR-associated protein Cas5/CasD [Gammaproteobacteria bacterium]|nr:type I-E CRISPR-associated protein Cas5/CasD [Gammaproteobacteria bacterium]
MMRALLLALQGPLRSWGSMSLGDDRDTLEIPTASAVVGFLGACAGIDRHTPAALDAWYSAWDVMTLSVRRYRYKPEKGFSELRGPRLRVDFQSAHNSLSMEGKTLKDAVIGNRGYLEEALDIVALILRKQARPELAELALLGLRTPVFTPYLGRRSNPLSDFPLNPVNGGIAEADDYEMLADTLLEGLHETMAEKSCTPEEAVLVVPGGWLETWKGGRPLYAKNLPDQRNGANLTYAQRLCDWFYWKGATQ